MQLLGLNNYRIHSFKTHLCHPLRILEEEYLEPVCGVKKSIKKGKVIHPLPSPSLPLPSLPFPSLGWLFFRILKSDIIQFGRFLDVVRKVKNFTPCGKYPPYPLQQLLTPIVVEVRELRLPLPQLPTAHPSSCVIKPHVFSPFNQR